MGRTPACGGSLAGAGCGGVGVSTGVGAESPGIKMAGWTGPADSTGMVATGVPNGLLAAIATATAPTNRTAAAAIHSSLADLGLASAASCPATLPADTG